MTTGFQLTGAHLIDGQWVNGRDGARAADPATGSPLEPPYGEAGGHEIDAAFAAATAAFSQTADLASERWARLLETIAEESEKLSESLVARAWLESALPEARLKGEMARTTGQLRLFAQLVREGRWLDAVIDRADLNRKPLPKPDIRRMLRRLGPVVNFDASNFPFAFGACGGDTASALAAGNPVIVKAHPGHPGTDELFGEVVRRTLERCALPAGLFSVLHGAGHGVGLGLVQHPAAAAVAFTGSQQAGRALFDAAARRERPIPVFAEMGSVNPLVALPGAIAERAERLAEGLAQSITMGSGQFCTKPGLVLYVGDADSARFTAALEQRLAAGPTLTMLNAAIRDRHAATLQAMIRIPGVRSLAAGSTSGGASSTPTLLAIDSDLLRERPLLAEEAFGPSALLVRCRHTADMLDALGLLTGQLTGTVHAGVTDPPELVRAVVSRLEGVVGRVIFNGFPTGVEVCRAMVHGGPYPATTAPATTSVGTAAISRFARPVAFQDLPDSLLPPALQNANPLGIPRMVDGIMTDSAIA